MSDDLILQALEANYEAFVLMQEQRADALEMIDNIDEEMAKITPKIIGLAALVDLPEDSPIARFLTEIANTGLTDAVRNVLRGLPLAMRARPSGIRDSLIKMGVDLSGYQNPMAVIGSILKRLEEAGEVKKTPHEQGPVYNWIRPTDSVRNGFKERFIQGLKAQPDFKPVKMVDEKGKPVKVNK